MEEAPITGSFASEVSAIVAEEIFESLTAPIKRVCAPDTPTPYSTPMEKWWMPDDEDLVRAVTAITI
jgi:pyruvate dehydrogenase E1 component beta subunit